jgi:hypothetical protein
MIVCVHEWIWNENMNMNMMNMIQIETSRLFQIIFFYEGHQNLI